MTQWYRFITDRWCWDVPAGKVAAGRWTACRWRRSSGRSKPERSG